EPPPHGVMGRRVGFRRARPRHPGVAPQPAGGAERVNDPVNMAGTPPHRQLGHRGTIRPAHRLAPQLLPHCDVLATLIPGGQRHHAALMTARSVSHAPSTRPPDLRRSMRTSKVHPAQAAKNPATALIPVQNGSPPLISRSPTTAAERAGLAPVAGGRAWRFTTDEAEAATPTPTPDGTQVAWVSTKDGTRRSTWPVSPTGAAPG